MLPHPTFAQIAADWVENLDRFSRFGQATAALAASGDPTERPWRSGTRQIWLRGQKAQLMS
jgi:hypothetical protein